MADLVKETVTKPLGAGAHGVPPGKGKLISKEPLNHLDPPLFIILGSKNYPGFLCLNFSPFFKIEI